MSKNRHVIQCQECETPVAELRAGALIIKSRHHNKPHVTVIPFEVVREWIRMAEQDQGKKAA